MWLEDLRAVNGGPGPFSEGGDGQDGRRIRGGWVPVEEEEAGVCEGDAEVKRGPEQDVRPGGRHGWTRGEDVQDICPGFCTVQAGWVGYLSEPVSTLLCRKEIME